MSETWHHPTLGLFENQIDRWVGRIGLAAFHPFSYARDEFGDGRFKLVFLVEDADTDEPSPAAAALAERVVANQSRLAAAARGASWDNFTGFGPRSGMWWHGRLDRVTEGADRHLPPLTGPDALLAWMRLSRLVIHGDGSHDGGPVAELAFAAEFEQEHGVGILTDGEKVIGVGYSGDCVLFDT